MSTLLTPPSRHEFVETLQSSQWSIQHLLRKSCEVTQALGAVLMTQVDGAEPQYKSGHRVAKALAEQIIDQFKNEPFSPGKIACALKIIGMGTVLCMSVSTLINQSESGRWNQARLIVIVPAERQIRNHVVSLLEGVLNDIGLALNYYQRHAAYFARFDEQAGIKNCLICENLQSSTGEWLRWNEFLVRQIGMRLSHTICCTCAAIHYPECTGVKNEAQNFHTNRNSIFEPAHQAGGIDVCAICENLSTGEGGWVRWDEYISRMARVAFTHTLCTACSGHYQIDWVKIHGRSDLVGVVA